MRLYIDEVGNSDLQGASADPNVRYLALTGIIARRQQHQDAITPALEHVKRHFIDSARGRPIILHRRDIMRREGMFAVLNNDKTREEFNAELADCISTQPFIVNTVQIDKKAHLETYKVWHFEPYHYCLCCIVERFTLYLERVGGRGDVVVEVRGRKPDKKLKESYARIYERGTDNIKPERFQAVLTSRELGFHSKADNVAGLQIADVLAHPAARYMRFKRYSLRKRLLIPALRHNPDR